MRHIKRAGGIIFYHNKLLVVLNKLSKLKGDCKYGCPKGHRKNKELLINCANREIYEETGLDINIDFKNTPYKIIEDTIYYIIKYPIEQSVNIKDVNEISEVCFMTKEQLIEVNKNRSLKIICKHFNNIYNKII
mgnify:CR=1 FL=1